MFGDLSIESVRNILVICAVIILIILLKKTGLLCCKECKINNAYATTSQSSQKSGFTEFGKHTALAIRTVGRLDAEPDKINNTGEQPKDDLLQKVYHHEEPQESQAYTHFSKRNSRNPNYKTASNFLLRR